MSRFHCEQVSGYLAFFCAGPFTVFGPTDTAFSLIPDWLKKAIEDKRVLAKVLEYHVLPGKVLSKDIKNEATIKTLLGKSIRFNIYPNKVVLLDCLLSHFVSVSLTHTLTHLHTHTHTHIYTHTHTHHTHTHTYIHTHTYTHTHKHTEGVYFQSTHMWTSGGSDLSRGFALTLPWTFARD